MNKLTPFVFRVFALDELGAAYSAIATGRTRGKLVSTSPHAPKSADDSVKRHSPPVALYCNQLAARFLAWREFAELTQNPSFDF